MENTINVEQMSAEELTRLAEQKAKEEREAKEAESKAIVESLQAELKTAQDGVEQARNTRKEMINNAKEAAKKEGDKIVEAAQEVVNNIRTKIKEAGGSASKTSTGTRTKSEGWGNRDRNSTVLAVLGEFDGPATPKQVCERIMEDGLYKGQTTSLQVAVSSALNALADAGEATKEGKRRGCTYKVS